MLNPLSSYLRLGLSYLEADLTFRVGTGVADFLLLVYNIYFVGVGRMRCLQLVICPEGNMG